MKNWAPFLTLALGSVGTLFFTTTFPTADSVVLRQTPGKMEEKVPSMATSSKGSLEQFQCTTSLSNEIINYPPVFIFAPAKAGGTSLRLFQNKCYKQSGGADIIPMPDNWMNHKKDYVDYLLQNPQPPKVMVSHLYTPTPLLDAVRHASRDAIIIYVYRDEKDRIVSAIREVAAAFDTNSTALFQNRFGKPIESRRDDFGLEVALVNDTRTLTFDEKPFVTEAIKPRRGEIGYSIPRDLQCEFWNELHETGPDRFFFVHFSALDKLQTTLASRYCPTVTPQKANVAGQKAHFMLRMQNHSLIDLDDWLAAKKDHIEFLLEMSGERESGSGPGSCKHKTRDMEDKLSVCESGVLQWFM
mmetsp:Transcript_117455/g.339583  ORF Transcript_117455/g.339583 Transcript_117455/m.339583 type:complete len:357 (-) Transcript_117455:58-1128(-)|eukprot:CAMPEP_0176009848 /NCGR_PEP_ID=MMETSP0120_2-20121206/4462_1 /TAXON_ID=160619 /ORGANISM="Kryptoperidinium foliaceum, Strain CCMP 1326" /LENGTH=356 /DNA_ID=CAMNT_0017342657 /DNA_START=57 /DNA_END=1127 /DNA_ORIENTATION=+